MATNREYQRQAVFKLNRALNNSRNPVYLAPCGTGKTHVAAQLIRDRLRIGRRVFVIVPQVEIFDEWMRVFDEYHIEAGFVNDEGIRGRNRMVYVCMALSLVNMLPLLPERFYPDEIITDEMQHSLAYSWESIYRFFPKALRVGLTATLYHGSLRSFEHLYDTVIQTISKREAIDDGFITKPLLVAPEDYVGDIPKNGEEYDQVVQQNILGKPKIIGDVVDFYTQTFAGRPVIVPCSTYDHASTMCLEFQKAGWYFDHLHSGLAKAERKRMLRHVAQGKTNGICTVGIGIEGMSIPGLWGVLWLRRTASPIIWTQFNGRAERVLPGKTYYICADFVGNSVLHGMPDRHIVWRLTQDNAEITGIDDRPMMRLCPVCGVMNAYDNTECHFCHMPLDGSEDVPGKEKRGFPAIVDGRLVVVEDNEANCEELREKSESIKRQQEEIRNRENQAIPMQTTEKVSILRSGIFKGTRRKLFEDAVKNWL